MVLVLMKQRSGPNVVLGGESDVEDANNGPSNAREPGSAEPASTDGADNNRYNLRASRGRLYSHRFDHQMDEPESGQRYEARIQLLQDAVEKIAELPTDTYKHICGHVMTQMLATAGIKKHGQPAVDALLAEFGQLDDKNVFEPCDASLLSKEQKKEALRAVNLIKEKHCGRLKGRTCADGWSQQAKYTKEETSSPTVSTDALMLSIIIDAYEKRDVTTADVEGAYLHADMEDFVLLKMVGEAVDIMCDVNPKYAPFVVVESGKRVLYLRLLKALYGCVKSALLWYELFTETLIGMGFELNPYDPCVANSMINGKQCTIAWYVDDNKILHVSPKVVTRIVEAIEARFGKMTVVRGKQHLFLGMDILYNDDGTATITMKDYLMESIADSGPLHSQKKVEFDDHTYGIRQIFLHVRFHGV